ncbi:hypothetical protein Franean1_1855 [Parafrankia sp. EAN1pec]|nr:hypothetical protein Franean1_1855 [Frankia sp. EAN1pec]
MIHIHNRGPKGDHLDNSAERSWTMGAVTAPGQLHASGPRGALEAPGRSRPGDGDAWTTPAVSPATGDDESGSGHRAALGPAAGPSELEPGFEAEPRPGLNRRGRFRRRSVTGRRSPLTRHSVFGVFLLAGVVLRLVTTYAYRPVFEFNGDSYAYIRLTRLSEPDPMRPAGYPAFLRVLTETGADLWVVPLVQHVLGILLATALYVLLLHRRVAPPIAALATAPILLDAYQIVIEHFVMAETLFAVLLVAAVVALMWSRRPSVWAFALAGLLLGASGLVRTIGVAIGLLAFGYVVLRRVGWLRVGVFAVFLAAPLIAYASWFQSAHGKIGLTGGDAAWLYGRVAPIADCGQLDLEPSQLSLCSPHPVGERPDPSYYVWDRNSPSNQLDVPVDERDRLLNDFSRQVITRQPVDYLRMVGSDIAHYFEPGRRVGPRDWPDATWRFPTADEPRYLHNDEPLLGLHGEADRPDRTVIEPWADYLRAYQSRGFTPGPALAVAGVLGLLSCLAALPRVVPAGLRGGDGRARWHDLTAERRRTGADCLFLVATGATMIIVPAATVCFDYRYLLPALFLLPPAAALAVHQGHLLVVAWRERREAAETPWRTPPGPTGLGAADPDTDGDPTGADTLSATETGPDGGGATGFGAPGDRADPDAPFSLGGLGAPPGRVAPAGHGDHREGRPTRPATPARPIPPTTPNPPAPIPPTDPIPSAASARPAPLRSGPNPGAAAARRQNPSGTPPLPKRAPGVTLEARNRRSRPAAAGGAAPETPSGRSTPQRRPVSLGPDARMPTPGSRPAARGPAAANAGDDPTAPPTKVEPDAGDDPTFPG